MFYLEAILYDAIWFLTVYGIFPIFIFFYTFALGLREANSKLKIREIAQNLIKKLF